MLLIQGFMRVELTRSVPTGVACVWLPRSKTHVARKPSFSIQVGLCGGAMVFTGDTRTGVTEGCITCFLQPRVSVNNRAEKHREHGWEELDGVSIGWEVSSEALGAWGMERAVKRQRHATHIKDPPASWRKGPFGQYTKGCRRGGLIRQFTTFKEHFGMSEMNSKTTWVGWYT